MLNAHSSLRFIAVYNSDFDFTINYFNHNFTIEGYHTFILSDYAVVYFTNNIVVIHNYYYRVVKQNFYQVIVNNDAVIVSCIVACISSTIYDVKVVNDVNDTVYYISGINI